MPNDVPPFRRGQPLKAEDLERLRAANRANQLQGPGISRSSAGTTIAPNLPDAIFARLVAHIGSGIYSWRQVIIDPSDGSWSDGDLSGDAAGTGARDINGSATFTLNKRVYLRRFPGGGWWFQGAC